MTREGALTVMIAVTILLLGALAFAWWRRTRRDATPLAPAGELPPGSTVLTEFDGFYVATTRHGEPLERLAAPGLAYRSRVHITVADTAVVLALAGATPLLLTADRLVEVAPSTVAIDRVVEPGGLTRLTWRTLADTVVDTYLRPQDASTKALTDAIRPLVASAVLRGEVPRTGSDA